MSIKTWMLVLLMFLSVVPVVILDSVMPLGNGEVIFYFLPVLISSITSNRIVIYLAMGITLILMIIGYFISPPGIKYVSIINRMGVFGINWFVVCLILKRMSTIKELQQAQINERKNIAELKKAETRLRESENRFRELANSMPQLVWTAEPDGNVDYYNERYKDFEGIVASEPGGKWEWGFVVHPDDLEATEKRWVHAVKSGEIYEIEHRIKHVDGSYHWYLSRAVPVHDGNGKILKWYGTTTNIDLSKKALHDLEENEKKLKILNENLESMVIQRTTQVRSLSYALSFAEQRERRRISYVLHENLQQKLLGARLLLGQHFRDHEKQTSEKYQPDDIADSIDLLEEAIDTTRFLSIELNPPILQSQGLDASLKWLVKHMKRAYGLDTNMNIRGNIKSVRNEKQLMLTQMVRELLNNVIKHSGVKDAQLDAVNEGGQIEITVSDKGRGFNTDEAFKRSSDDTRLSLFSIRERLSLFNGELEIKSREGQGTTCIIRLPDNNY